MSGILGIMKSYPRTFWVANTIELFERWAWYGFYMLFANYLIGSVDEGGLEFTKSQQSTIMGFGTGILYFLPVITGAIADHYGYKKMLLFSFVMYISAFLLFPLFDSYTEVFLVYIYLAVGGAMFKPIISATIAKTTNDSNSSIGFGIFYMMVNVGSFLGPLASLIAKKQSSDMVFYLAAALIAVNFIMILFYKEPERKEARQGSLGKALKNVLIQIVTVFRDWKFMVFLSIIAIFWAMYFQLFFTLPVFIGQWIDTSVMYNFFSDSPFILENYTKNGQMDPEFITNFDAMFIVLFQVIVSSVVMRMKPLNSMMAGIVVNAIGLSLSFLTQNVFFVIFALFVFGIGEMAASPKVTEYIGRIAPKDKKALYMGFSFVPLFLGSMLAGVLAGPVYEYTSDLDTMVKSYATEQGFQLADDLKKNEILTEVANQSQMSISELKQFFWESYNPSSFWYVSMSFGIIAMLCLFFYDRLILRKTE